MFAPGLKERLAQAADRNDDPAFEQDIRPWSPFTQLQYRELTIRLPNFITRTLDRASMAHGAEASVPFLDHELVELCARIPPALKMRGLQEKYILRQAMRDVSADRLREKGYFVPDVVRGMLVRHRWQRTSREGSLLMGVLAIQLWDDLFMRSQGQIEAG